MNVFYKEITVRAIGETICCIDAFYDNSTDSIKIIKVQYGILSELMMDTLITHGHKTGYIAAGALAVIIASIIEGNRIEAAAIDALGKLRHFESPMEVYWKLFKATELYRENARDEEAINELGEGWTAEEALAIGVFCALKYKDDFKKGIIAAVNHDGDSDSTGSITGNILGSFLGVEAIPDEWIKRLELIDLIKQVANDLLLQKLGGGEEWNKWPGY